MDKRRSLFQVLSTKHKLIALYLVWLMIHLTILFMFSNDPLSDWEDTGGFNEFWPFGRYIDLDNKHFDLYKYGVREFFFFSLSPFMIVTVLFLFAPVVGSKEDG